MRFRKMLMAGAACLALCILPVVPVSAHGHHHRQVKADTSYPVCTVEDCSETGHHLHDGVYYCGYDHESGYCDGSCQQTARRSHHGKGHHGCH